MSQRVVVIGASRGIGKELVKQLSQSGNTQVIASTHSPQAGPTCPNVKFITFDINILIINAGMGKPDLLLDTSSEHLASYLDTNVIGSHRIIRAFLPALLARKKRQIILVSSTSGSNEMQCGSRTRFQGQYPVSKAALNMLAVQYHNEPQDQGFTVVPIHPGWVATDMGNVTTGLGGMKVEDSVKAMLDVVDN